MAECLLAQHFNGLIVDDFKSAALIFSDEAIVAIAVVWIERDIGDDTELGVSGLECFDGTRNEAVIIVALRRIRAL